MAPAGQSSILGSNDDGRCHMFQYLAKGSLALLLLLGCQGSGPSGNVSAGPGGPRAIPVSTEDFAFEPGSLALPPGEEVEVEIRNEGSSVHDFTIERLDLSTGPIQGGEVATATFVVPPGRTTFMCSLHLGMDGSIVGG
jgi:plastocyanin